MTTTLTRRALLGAAGVSVALPLMESFLPRKQANAGGTPIPKRMIVWYVPNGINGSSQNAWRPATEGSAYALTPMLAPLGALRSEALVLTGLTNLPASYSYMGSNDGGGDHARGTGSFLTCARPLKTEGRDIRNGISADQVAANAIGMRTRFPSLQLGTESGASTGGCDSGYSCAYSNNISWASAETPLPKLTSPVTVFDRIFAGGESAALRARRNVYQSSVLDYIRRDATRLSTQLGQTDRRKLEEYLTAVRELERRIMNPTGAVVCATPPRPMDGLGSAEHVQVMTQLMVLAMRCDATRVITFMLGNGGSGRDYEFIGAPGAHHETSHHQMDAQKIAKLQAIGTWEVLQFANMLQQMAMLREMDGTSMLDNSVALFSSEISDGDAHSHEQLPVLLAGRCGRQFDTGRHVVYSTPRPIANLYIAMIRAVGGEATRFGLEGTRPLENLGAVSTA
jgi:Protein of unknown function (DUF1552)